MDKTKLISASLFEMFVKSFYIRVIIMLVITKVAIRYL